MQALITTLARSGTAITVSPATDEQFYPFGVPLDPLTRSLLSPRALDRYQRLRAPIDQRPPERARIVLSKYQRAWAAERMFRQAGGLLLVGTDTSSMGGCIAGPCTHRTVEMLVEQMGFTPVEALQIATRDGARFLRRNDIGAIRPGIPANLVIVRGRPDENIRAIRRIETVFRNGVGYDSVKLFESAHGLIGS
jgi:predicted amidohydrolase YtcJ